METLGPPETIGPYRIVGLLGAGGMGVVYRAEHPETGERVAVKTVRVVGDGLLASIRREIHALARVSHPGVVRVTAAGLDDGLPWCAMELIEGASLRELLAGGERDRLLALAARMCATLAYLHGEGIVHCDLKPENVIVRDDGTPVLVDFGLAAHVADPLGREALDVADDAAGTVAYMAPEQISGEVVDARADLYALGCILYEIVTGRHPFVRSRPIEVAWAHLEATPAAPSEVAPGVSPDLDALILRLLAKQPADRIGYAADVATALAPAGARTDPDGPRPRPYLYRPALAGRAAPLARLRRMIARLEGGAGGLVFVGGESGIGKTRFVVELSRVARAEGARVLAAESTYVAGTRGGVAPLGSMRKILETIGDRCRERGEKETERLLGPRARVLGAYEPSLAKLPGADRYPAPDDLAPAAARLRLYACLAETFAAFVAAGAPLVVILDDLQWADELTLGFLEYLLDGNRLEGSRTLVVGTYRPEEASGTVSWLVESDRAVRVDLDRLDTAAVAAIVGDMLALAPPPQILSRYLARQSEGNPFFVAEYVRAAVDAGLLARDESGAWRVSEAGPKDSRHEVLPLPGTLREVVARRLDALPRVPLLVARAAAVLGRDVEFGVLARVAGLAEADALEATDELLRRHVFAEASPGLLRFAHDKLREVAYAGVAAEERSRLHGAAALALEAAPVHADFAALGAHWQHAGERERARRAYLAGARLARDRYAHEEAERLYRAFLALADVPGRDRVEARVELAYDVLRPRGRGEDAAAELVDARLDARALGDTAAEAECLRQLGCVLWELSRMEEAIVSFEAALSLADGDRRFEGVTVGNLANVYLQQGRTDEALELYRRSLEVHREIGDRYGEGIKIGNIAIVYYNRGDYARARPLYEEAVAIMREVGNGPAEAKMLGNLALLCSDTGDYDEAQELFERALEIARDVGDRREEGIVLYNLGVNCQRLARYDEALAHSERALAILAETKSRSFEAAARNFRATLERQTGRLERAARSSELAVATHREIGGRLHLALAVVEAGMQALARGQSARDLIAEAEALADELDLGPESQVRTNLGVLHRAETALAAGERLIRGERRAELDPAFRRYLESTGELPAE